MVNSFNANSLTVFCDFKLFDSASSSLLSSSLELDELEIKLITSFGDSSRFSTFSSTFVSTFSTSSTLFSTGSEPEMTFSTFENSVSSLLDVDGVSVSSISTISD